MTTRLLSWLPLALVALILSGCKPQPATTEAPTGYALLYGVSSQEQDVDYLMWIKDPGQQITAWVKEIATFNGEVTKQLDAWKKDGSVTNLKVTNLPPTEVKARDRAAERTSGKLLWGGGVDLRTELLLSQISALQYCGDLCYAMSKMDYAKAHKDTLTAWDTRFDELAVEGINILESGEFLDYEKKLKHNAPGK